MAISVSNLTSGSSSVNGPWTTASITPTANKLILLTVEIRNGASVNPDTPSISGNGLTWVLINSVVFDPDSSSRKTQFLFRAMGASPSTGTVVITNAETDTSAAWIIDEVSGMDTSGTNGSGAIVQSTTNSDTTGSASGLTVTLSAFSDANNSTYGSLVNDAPNPWTVGSGFSSIQANNTAAVDMLTEFKVANDTTVDGTFTNIAGIRVGGIAIEIKIAPTTQIKKVSSVAYASIKKISGVAIASVKKVAGLA